MLRVASMNLSSMVSKTPPPRKFWFPKQTGLQLANPPFKGQLDFEDVHSSLLKQVKTKKTELLFVVSFLKSSGRSATIVPDETDPQMPM